MNVLSLFDGMSGAQIALERVGIKVDNYYASEIWKHAITITQRNYPNTIQVGDVRTLQPEDFPHIDLLVGGSPCQDLSMLQMGEGIYGEKSTLIWQYIGLLRALKPDYFLLENVRPRKPEWKQDIDSLMGVEGVLINSDRFVQQNRPRYYWTNIPIKPLPERPDWQGNFWQYRRTYYRPNQSGVCPCLTANMGTGGHNVPLHSPDKWDKLSPVEVERLQGVPDNYTAGVANCHRYRMLGDGFTIDVIAHIFEGLKLGKEWL